MNIIFLTLSGMKSVEDRGIYSDLLRTFRDNGHDVTIVSPAERRTGISTNLSEVDGVRILKVKTLNITKTNIVEKGLSTLAIEYQYLAAIKKYLSDVKFDIVLYSTPPITFEKVISYIKKRDNAYSYLLLKDIFPQNAVDMGMIKKGGLIHKFFLRKEKRLYEISDTIGCMSQANVDFVVNNNSNLDNSKVVINPNSIEPKHIEYCEEEKNDIKNKYGLPLDKKIFVYGGNLGIPQGIDFLLQAIENLEEPNAHILVVGSGTQFTKIKTWFDVNEPKNATLLSGLPKDEYDLLLGSCDIGMIFLHKDFTIPNFPSRLLSYLEMKMPVLAATDINTDIGKVIEDARCGYWVEWGDNIAFQQKISQLCNDNINEMGENAWTLLQDEYLVDRSYRLVIDTLMQ